MQRVRQVPRRSTMAGRLRVSAGWLTAALSASVLLAPAAVADPIDNAVAALRSSPVYVGANAPSIHQSALGAGTLDGIRVAIVPTNGPDAVSVAKSIGARLDANGNGLTVLVFEGRTFGVASSAHCGVGTDIQAAVNRHRAQLTASNDVTATVADFAAAVRAEPSAAKGCSGSAPVGTGVGSAPKSSSHTGLVIVLVIIALLIAIVWYVVHARRRRARRVLADARAQVLPYYDLLAAEVNRLHAEGNPTARQAIADAAERLSSAGDQLAGADSAAKFAQARRTTLEGLYATRTARAALGLDLGPQLPPIDGPGTAQLTEPQQVSVQGQTFQGYPNYTPAAPYFYGGGYGVPGGWYGAPFWETMLLGSVLAGGFGGFGGFGGYGAGYDNGYLTGYDAGENATDAADNANASGDGTGSGDASGSSGWGDSSGGGDWVGDSSGFDGGGFGAGGFDAGGFDSGGGSGDGGGSW